MCEQILPVPADLYRNCSWEQMVCRSCREKIPWIREPVCKKCGRAIEDETAELCTSCERNRRPFTEGRGAVSYCREMRESVLRMKFHNHREYLDFYAAVMACTGEAYLKRIRPDAIIPVPMNIRKRRERGFDQCRMLAQKLSARTGIPVEKKVLFRTKNTRPQKGLNRQQRKENLSGAFAVKTDRELPERVLLVDDIFTTGSTIEACCEALMHAGIARIYVLVLCID